MAKYEVLIKAVVLQGLSYGEVARRHGVSKTLVHKLHHRWLREGDAAFEPRSRRPISSRSGTAQIVGARVLQLRDKLVVDGLDAGADTIKKHLDTQPAASLTDLQATLDAFRDYYNHVRPHRGIGRKTPSFAYQLIPKAIPTPPVDPDLWRVRYDTIDRDGKISLRHSGRMLHLGIGRAHARTEIICLIHNNDAMGGCDHRGPRRTRPRRRLFRVLECRRTSARRDPRRGDRRHRPGLCSSAAVRSARNQSEPAWVEVDQGTPEELAALARDYLAAGFAWPTDPQGIHEGQSLLKLRPEDLAKLGLLYLNGGVWEGESVVSAAWVEAATTTHVETFSTPSGYGYQWWTHDEGGDPMFLAVGYAGNLVAVVPDRDLVAVVASAYDGIDPLENAQKFNTEEAITLVQYVILAQPG